MFMCLAKQYSSPVPFRHAAQSAQLGARFSELGAASVSFIYKKTGMLSA